LAETLTKPFLAPSTPPQLTLYGILLQCVACLSVTLMALVACWQQIQSCDAFPGPFDGYYKEKIDKAHAFSVEASTARCVGDVLNCCALPLTMIPVMVSQKGRPFVQDAHVCERERESVCVHVQSAWGHTLRLFSIYFDRDFKWDGRSSQFKEWCVRSQGFIARSRGITLSTISILESQLQASIDVARNLVRLSTQTLLFNLFFFGVSML
jgi:hypothetical protein